MIWTQTCRRLGAFTVFTRTWLGRRMTSQLYTGLRGACLLLMWQPGSRRGFLFELEGHEPFFRHPKCESRLPMIN